MLRCLTHHASRRPSMLGCSTQHICRSRLAGEPARSATTAVNDTTRSPASRFLQIESDRPGCLSSPAQSNPTDSAAGQSILECLTQHTRRSRLADEPVRSATTAVNDTMRSPASRLLQIESNRPECLSSPAQSNPTDPAAGQSMLRCLTQHTRRSRLADEPVRSATTAVNDTTRSPASRLLRIESNRTDSVGLPAQSNPTDSAAGQSILECLTQHTRRSRLAGEPARSATTAVNDTTRSPASRLLQIESNRPGCLSSPAQLNPTDPAAGQSMLRCSTQHTRRSRLAGEPARSATTAVNDTTRSPASRAPTGRSSSSVQPCPTGGL